MNTIKGCAKDRRNLNHFNILNATPGLYAAPVTEATDVEDRETFEVTPFGGDVSFSGAVPAFVEAGLEQQTRSATNRATIRSTYTVEGSAGSANRDASRLKEEGPSDKTHIWMGIPIITDVNQAVADIEGGLKVLGNASQDLTSRLNGFIEQDQAQQATLQLNAGCFLLHSG